MGKSANLPLYRDFLEIFDKYEVKGWNAKDFVNKLPLYKLNESNKKKMYQGLQILVRCKYLVIDPTTSKKNKFSYSETKRANELRMRIKKEKLEQIFSSKKAIFLQEVLAKENNINFIKDILSTDNSLEKYLIEYKEMFELDVQKLNSNINLMDDILNKCSNNEGH